MGGESCIAGFQALATKNGTAAQSLLQLENETVAQQRAGCSEIRMIRGCSELVAVRIRMRMLSRELAAVR